MPSAEVTFFDSLFVDVDPVLDEVFAKTFIYRRAGFAIPLPASLQAHDIEADETSGIMDSWHGHNFTLRTADLVLPDGTPFRPESGDEIAEQTTWGCRVYEVLPPPNKRVYEPVDAEETKLLVYAKLKGEEPA
jgi:hypothetical protein